MAPSLSSISIYIFVKKIFFVKVCSALFFVFIKYDNRFNAGAQLTTIGEQVKWMISQVIEHAQGMHFIIEAKPFEQQQNQI